MNPKELKPGQVVFWQRKKAKVLNCLRSVKVVRIALDGSEFMVTPDEITTADERQKERDKRWAGENSQILWNYKEGYKMTATAASLGFTYRHVVYVVYEAKRRGMI